MAASLKLVGCAYLSEVFRDSSISATIKIKLVFWGENKSILGTLYTVKAGLKPAVKFHTLFFQTSQPFRSWGAWDQLLSLWINLDLKKKWIPPNPLSICIMQAIRVEIKPILNLKSTNLSSKYHLWNCMCLHTWLPHFLNVIFNFLYFESLVKLCLKNSTYNGCAFPSVSILILLGVTKSRLLVFHMVGRKYSTLMKNLSI